MENFESVLLKKMFYDGQFFNHVFASIKSEYFTDIGNSEIFKLFQDYYEEYRQPPKITEVVVKVKDLANAEIKKQIVQSLQKIKDVDLSDLSNNEFLSNETLRWIKDALYYKALELGAKGLQNHDEDLQIKAKAILDEREKVSFDDTLSLEFSDSEKMIEYFQKRDIGILTRHKSINCRLGTGFLPGTLNVILASQGIGKSLLMCDLGTGMLLNNKKVLLVSLEMSDYEMMKRIYANALNIDINTFSDLSKTDIEKEKITERQIVTKEQIINKINELQINGKLGKFYIKSYPTGTFSSAQLQDLIQKFKIEKNTELDCVFVDYLGIMRSDLRTKNVGLYEYIKAIAEELRSVAVKLNIPIISCSQLNRGAINSTDADNSNVADSIGTNATADWMLMILQNEKLKEESEVVMKVTKNRYNGRTDTFTMGVDYPKMKFVELEENTEKIVEDTPIKTMLTKTDDFDLKIETPVQKINSNSSNNSNSINTDDDLLKELGLC